MTSRLAFRLSLATTFALVAVAAAASCSSDENDHKPLGDSTEVGGSSGAGGKSGGKSGAAGSGGTEAGSAGAEQGGSGGTEAGSSGSGGTEAGSGGTEAGNGGSEQGGSGGTEAGSGGSESGSGGTEAGSGGTEAGSGGSEAGSGGTEAGSGGSEAGSGGTTAGSSGSAGESGEGGTEQGGTGGTAQGGTGGTGGDDDGPMPEQIGGSGGAPLSWSCNQDLSLWATPSKIKFDGNTPAALANAFSEIAGGIKPISLVLRKSGNQMTGAVSATTTNGAGKEVFPAGNKPEIRNAVVPFNNPSSLIVDGAQSEAYLRFIDKQGPVTVKLTHVIWQATQSSANCNDLTVTLSADLVGPPINTPLHLASGTKTIAEICGLPPGSNDPEPCPMPAMCNGSVQTINITFHGEPMSFDFSAL